MRAVVNIYSPPCDIEAELVPVSSIDDLQGLEITGKIEVSRGYGEYVQGLFVESDHSFFWPLVIPNLAFTSMCMDLLCEVTHTENDTMCRSVATKKLIDKWVIKWTQSS